MKKLILVTSPPACGKTFISKQLAKALNHVVYLDKDTLIPLSKQIFAVAHQPYDRSSIFFEKYIRDLEYRVVLDLAMEALEYDDIVLINAPFTQEIRDLDYITTLRAELKKKQAELVVIWVDTNPEVCHQRMIDRASDRDIDVYKRQLLDNILPLDGGHGIIIDRHAIFVAEAVFQPVCHIIRYAGIFLCGFRRAGFGRRRQRRKQPCCHNSCRSQAGCAQF